MKLTIILCLVLIQSLSLPFVYSNIYSSCINNKHATLTFDDGPHENTPAVVKILDNYNISGAFFINGLSVKKDNKYKFIKELSDKGHIIGSHGFSHGAMERLNNFNQLRELYDNEMLFREIFNKRPLFYRPPYFSYNTDIYDKINNFGYQLILSNLNTDDWMMDSANDIYDSFLNKFSNYSGLIILQHDYQIYNNEALIKMIEYTISQNYTFVPMDICVGANKRFQEDNTYGPNLDNGLNLNM